MAGQVASKHRGGGPAWARLAWAAVPASWLRRFLDLDLYDRVSKAVALARWLLFSGQPSHNAFSATGRSEIAAVLLSCRRVFWGLGLFSGVSNVLMLTGSFFMLQVYDRVLPSRSVPTLVGLGVLAIVLYGFQGVLDVIRGRINVRVGVLGDEALSPRIYDAIVRLPLKTRGDGDGLQPLRDLDSVRG